MPKTHVSAIGVMVDSAETRTLERSVDSITIKIHIIVKNILTV